MEKNFSLLSNDGELHVQVRLSGVSDEELRTNGVWTTVSHGYNPSYIVLKNNKK